jgi:exopolyphosphatase/pppGpp-phosphohydrolase
VGDLGAITIADLGGGSVGLASGQVGAEPDWSVSLAIGSSTLSAGLDVEARLRRIDLTRLDARVAATVAPYRRHVDRFPDRPLVLTGGMTRALAGLIETRRSGQAPPTVHGSYVSWGDLTRIVDCFAGVSASVRAQSPGIDKDRAAMAPVAAVVLRQTMRVFGTRRAIVSETGLCEGMLIDAVRETALAA